LWSWVGASIRSSITAPLVSRTISCWRGCRTSLICCAAARASRLSCSVYRTWSSRCCSTINYTSCSWINCSAWAVNNSSSCSVGRTSAWYSWTSAWSCTSSR
jgi:hypothetical protein